ncbi:hypothetical protein SETIT_7G035400v2 [Setaria italica]|uniref:Uncharacterized protein n=1 Tax=Setaria italica TaxID=4555 RepID=A0A368RRU3_SETIT|nr:hypothetical protein SETIT_7G035400v2 [Setaria italica]
MALLVKMGTGIMLFAALVMAMAFVFSSCSAASPCSPVVPCNATTCFEYCQKNNYKNFQTSCTPGEYYPICCCLVPGADGL